MEQILKLLEADDYTGMTLEQISSVLKINDMKKLKNDLIELEEQGDIYVSKKKRYFLTSKVGLLKGILKLNGRYGFVHGYNNESYFIHQNNYNGASHMDEVLIKVIVPAYDNNKSEAEVVKIIKRGFNKVVGTLNKRGRQYVVIPDDERFQDWIRVEKKYLNSAIDGHKVVVGNLIHSEYNETSYPYQTRQLINGEIVEIIGHVNDPGVDILSVIKQYEINIDFDKEILDAIKQIPDQVLATDKKNRVDLTDKLIITIDGEDAKDLDDAISVEKIDEGYRLGVHIADVSYYVKENGLIDIEAMDRGTSVYLVDRVIPMLPHYLSNGICSLNPHVERLTISCIMDIDYQGKVIDHQIFPSVILSKQRMTYKDVNEILSGNAELIEKYQMIHQMLIDAKALADILRAKREKSGSIDFDVNEAKVKVDAMGKVIDIFVYERHDSERLIEDFMITANEVVAEHLFYMELPSIYRIHETPKKDKLRHFIAIANALGYRFKGLLENVHSKDLARIIDLVKEKEDFQILSTLLLRSMQKAIYSEENVGHFGLASNCYTHFTSPIRRYPDLIVHRLLRTYLFENKIDIKTISVYQNKLPQISKLSSDREVRAVDCERDVLEMKKAEYMLDHIGDEYDGIITGVTGFGCFVQLDNTIEGLVHVKDLGLKDNDRFVYNEHKLLLTSLVTDKKYKLGSKIHIKVKNVDKNNRKIDFIEVISE